MRVVAIQNSDPDTDFVFLSRSSHFATSGNGQFSNLIGQLVGMNGGKVYRASNNHGRAIGWHDVAACHSSANHSGIDQIECSV